MQHARVSELKRFLARLLSYSAHFLPAIGILAVACSACAQTSSAGGQSEHSSTRPVQIVPFREPAGASSAGQQPAGAHVTYFGGPVISNVHVVEVLYGGSGYLSGISSTTPPSVASFSTAITASPLFDMLNEYSTAGVTASDGKPGTSQTIGHGVFDGLFTITPSAANNGTTINDNQIQAELLAQVNAGNLPAPVSDAAGNLNTVYAIFFPPGKTIVLGNLSSCAPKGFCGYHSTTIGQFGGKNLLYSVLPDMQPPSGCSGGCGIGQPFDFVTNVLSHELSEAVTDADAGLASKVGRPLAWAQAADGQEVGDLCVGEEATFFSNGQPYDIQKIFSNFQNDCVTGPPVFNIAGGLTVLPGQEFDLPVMAQTDSGNTITGYTGTVHFTSTDPNASLPADYTFTAADAGFHTFVASLSTPSAPGGNQSITATDTAMPLFTGTANYIVPKSAISHFSVAEPGAAIQGVAIPVIVAARDSNNNLVTNYTGTIHFSTGDPAAVLPADSKLTNGTGTFSVTFNTAGFVKVVVADTADGTIFGAGQSNVTAPPPNPTATALSVSANPSTFGQSVTYKASLTQSGGPPPTIGSVNFSADGQIFAMVFNIDGSGNAQTTVSLNGGPHVIFADYIGGGSAHPPSSSAPLFVQVNPAPTTVMVGSSGSPSILGSKIFLNATLSSSNFTPDGGFVTFTDGAAPLAVISPLIGVASFGDTSLTVGSHTITAVYSGSSNFAGSTSAPFVQVVNAPPPPNYTLMADKNSATISAGQSATFTITTASINGFNGNISFSCGNLPLLATCSFVPPGTSVSPSATTATSTLIVKTAGPNALLLAPRRSPSGLYARFWGWSPIAAGVLLLAGARRRKRTYAVLGCLLTLLLVTALSSCGGGGTPPPPPARTPSGTTTMTVSASGTATGGSSQAANPNQTLSISITVQ